jgi:quercetin dioxygenase-like cupin family protein
MGQQGLITSRRFAPEQEATFRVVTELVTVRLSSAESGDAVTVLEIETPPGGGISPHTQRYEDETLYVLEGTYLMLTGEEQREIGPGQTRFIPRGVRHGFVNAGSVPARMLVFLSPGGIHEQFIREIGDHPARPMWEADLAKILALAPAYGIEFETDFD